MDTRKQNLLLLAASLLFALLVAEVICRIWLFGPLALLPNYGNSTHDLGVSGLLKPSKYRRICFELKPGLNTMNKMASLRTNPLGLADREYSLQKPPGTYRVVVLGDSFTMPAGVKQADAWHTLLENSFNRNSAGRKYEFINFGVAGYSLDQDLATLEYRALKFSADHVIVGFCLSNDIPVVGQKELPFPYRVKSVTNPYLHCHIWTVAVQAYSRIRGRNWEPPDFDREKLKQELVRFRELGETHGFNVTVVALRRADEYEYRYGILKEAADAAGVRLIDAGSEFPDAGRRYWIYEADNHPNAEANRIFAGTIAKSLRLD